MIEIARGLIAANGLRSLKVRDVAEAADCSIGSVYNEFGDFDGLILTVNRETVQALTARLVAVPAEDPVRQLHGLAETYLTFAADHANLLRSLFEHRMEDDRPFPEDILLMVMQAFALMHEPMVRLLPDRDPEAGGVAGAHDVLRRARHHLARPGRANGRGAAGKAAPTVGAVRGYTPGGVGHPA